MNTAYIIYLGETLPHCTPSGRIMELLNETILQLITYHLILAMFRNMFKSNAGDSEAIETVVQLQFDDILGWSLIGHIMFLQIMNFLVILINTLLSVKKYLYLRKLKKQKEISITKVTQLTPLAQPVSRPLIAPEIPSVDNFMVGQTPEIPSVDNFMVGQTPFENIPLEIRKNAYQDDSVSA